MTTYTSEDLSRAVTNFRASARSVVTVPTYTESDLQTALQHFRSDSFQKEYRASVSAGDTYQTMKTADTVALREELDGLEKALFVAKKHKDVLDRYNKWGTATEIEAHGKHQAKEALRTVLAEYGYGEYGELERALAQKREYYNAALSAQKDERYLSEYDENGLLGLHNEALANGNAEEAYYFKGLADRKHIEGINELLTAETMDGEDTSVLYAMVELAHISDPERREQRERAVRDKLQSLGVDFDAYYSQITGERNINGRGIWKWLNHSVASGVNNFNKAVTSTLDLLIGKPLQAFGWDNNPVSASADYFDRAHAHYTYNRDLEARKMGGGAALNYGGQVIEGVVSAVPDALLAMATAGASKATSLSKIAAYASGSRLTRAGLTVQHMMQSPNYWASFARTYGLDYEQAKQMGASEETAIFGATLSSLINAGLETGIDGGSGIQGFAQVLTHGNKNKLLAWAESVLEEGGEEILQSFVNNLVAKTLYDDGVELADTEQMLLDGAMGSVVGAVLGGGQAVLKGVANKKAQVSARNLAYDKSGEYILANGSVEQFKAIVKRQAEVLPSEEGKRLLKAADVISEKSAPREIGKLFYRALSAQSVKADGESFRGEATTEIALEDKADYPYNMQTVIQEYIDSTNEDVLQYAEQCRADKSTEDRRVSLGAVSERQAGDMSQLLGIDFSGFQNAISKSALNHIEKRHGINGAADTSMSDLRDVARVGYILNDYDSVEITRSADGNEKYSRQFRDKNNAPAPLLKFTKKINGTYYAVVACPDSKWKKIWLVSAYITKNSSPVTQEVDVASPNLNARNDLASPGTAIAGVPYATQDRRSDTPTVDTTVPQNGTGVNTQYMQSGAGYATDAARDGGVEIGVRPSAMDDVFKTMSVHRRKKLYAALKEHTGVTIVEDVTLLADGEYDPATQIIRINPNRATPMTVIKHELTHYLESSKLLYGDFMNYAFEQSTAFREWLASKGHTVQTMRKEIVDRYAAKGVKLDAERGASADQEILANFAAEVLFTDINALRELGAQRPKLLQRLKHFVVGIIRRFSGTPAETELERLERMFAAALPNSQNKDTTTKNGVVKFSISDDTSSIREQIESYMDELNKMEPVFIATVPSTLRRKYDAAQWAIQELKKTGYQVDRQNFGTIYFRERDIRDAAEYADTPAEKAAFVAVPRVLKRGIEIGRHTNHKGRSKATITFAAPVVLNGIRGNMAVVVNLNGNRYTVHRIVSPDGSVFSFDESAQKNIEQESYQGVPPERSLADTTSSMSNTSIANPPTGVNTYSTQDGAKKFIAPEAEVEMSVGQLTDEELLAELRRRGMSDLPNPLQVAQFKPADALTTPTLRRNGPMNAVGDGTSAFADSVQNSDIFSDELKQLAAEDENVTRYDVITNAETLRDANERINTGGRAFVERLMQRDSDTYTTEDMAAAVILLRRYETVGDHESALALMEKLRKAGTKHGQAVQILSLLSRLTPDGMVMYAQKELSQAYEEMVKGQTNQWIAENEDRFKLTAEEMDFIRRRTWQAAQLPKGRDKDIRLAEIAALIQSKIPQKKGQAFKAWQRTAMLLNPKTQLRNVLGNATMVGAFMASDAVGSMIDKATAKRTGVRTTFAGLNRKAVGGMKTGFFESWDDFMRHISTRDIRADRFEIDNRSLDNFNEHHTGVAAPARNKLSHALNALDRFNSFLLEAGDRPFYEMWYLHSINGQMAAAGVSEPTADMIEIATLDALERTWQDTNALTKFLSNLKNGMNHIQFQGYGLGDAVLKFVKTPANLTKAMVEFSPVGLIKALAVDATRFNAAVKDGRVTPQMQRRFIKNLSNGIVGTFLTMIAAGLAAAGLVTGEQDEDKDVAAFERSVLGYQPYSVKIGNTSWSYDWMQPVGAHVAAMANYFQDKETAELAGEKLNCFNAILSALKSGGRVLFDQSFMQSIHTFLGDDDIVTNTINAILSDINAPVPQLLSQTASALDPTVRTTYEYGNDVQTAINKVLYKLPGARQTLAPSVDVLGNERKQSPNGVVRAFSSYISPANMGVGYDSAAGQEMYRLYEATGNAAAIAPSAPNYVSIAAGKRTLSADQKAAYQKVMGRTAAEAVESLLGNAAYQALSDEAKVEVLTGIYGYTRQLANNEVLELSLNESAAKVKAAVDGGVPTGLYFVLKQTADSDGNTSISQKEARAILDATEMTREQKAVMWRAFNKSWKNNPYGTYKYY